MTAASVLQAADRLRTAGDRAVPCPPVRDLLGATDVDSAYQVQLVLIGERIAQGRVRVGRKIGLTSPVVQAQLGVDQPDFGTLLDDMLVPPGGSVGPGRLLQPKVEAEVAFRLGADLDGDLTPDLVRAAVATAHAAIEIVDSRIAGWDISIVDTVADNASSGLFVIADRGVDLAECEPAEVEMSLAVNGETRSTGTGRACLGDPLHALLWLARTAAAQGAPLRAGEIVLSGALGPMVAVLPGDQVSAEITGLGPIAVTFEEDKQ